VAASAGPAAGEVFQRRDAATVEARGPLAGQLREISGEGRDAAGEDDDGSAERGGDQRADDSGDDAPAAAADLGEVHQPASSPS
jgi:hypothetical protein